MESSPHLVGGVGQTWFADAAGGAGLARWGGEMSRVAGAYSRANGHDPAVELFEDTDARGDALSEFDRAAPIAVDELAAFDAAVNTRARPPAVVRPTAPTGRNDVEPVAAPASVAMRARNDTVQRNLSGLVERVFLPVSGEPTRSIAFVAIGTDLDSGALAATAAEMLAERTSRTVCVVDANFRAPSLHARFGLPGTSGLAEALAADSPVADAARRIQRNLWVIPAGTSAAAPQLASAAARVRISQFVGQYDYVIVNAEPVNQGGDLAALLRLVGGVIVVISADSTRRETARRATHALTESGVTVIGAVLMNRRFPIPDALFRLF
jgi:Mrp family chromosome partitioning ATPase